MLFAPLLTTLSISLVALVKGAAIVPRATLDVFTPTIIQPNEATVWTVGQVETVVWDTSNAPVNISNGASVELNGVGTLVKGFSLREGSVQVTVPSTVVPGLYTITLFGDSGNESSTFRIFASG